MSSNLFDIQVWAKENNIRPRLIIDRGSRIVAVFRSGDDAVEYAERKGMASYSLDEFKIGFWLRTDNMNQEMEMFFRFCEYHNIEGFHFWDFEEEISAALQSHFDARLLTLSDWRGGTSLAGYEDEREYFIAFKDQSALTMFRLLFA